ncbi:MAG: hypothetical protein B7C54_00190 [Acidimicrobiales bacterium mtb01]|nr:MAG: hypothetical protein B7C54_00190 [Acidimicrobiales bacterium mtb01]
MEQCDLRLHVSENAGGPDGRSTFRLWNVFECSRFEFLNSIGVDCPDGIPPRIAFAWDGLIPDPTSPDEDRLIAVANGLNPDDWNEHIAFVARAPTPESRDAMGGITFEWL